MVLFPSVRNLPDSPQYHLVKKFLTVPYWQPEYASLFAGDILVDLPYAPPGMPQHLIPFEFQIYRHWLNETLHDWENTAEPAIIPTTDPDLFWAIRWGTGKSYWAKRHGEYTNELVYRIEVKDGKIQSFREYANPIAFYQAIDIVLPNFNYLLDSVSEAENVRMRPGEASHFTPQENLKRAVANFADPINGHDEDPESIYACDMVEVTPFAPKDMVERWEGTAFDIQTEWMFRTVPEWNVIDHSPFYQAVDPNVIVVESYGYGRTTWSNKEGHYTQRELQIVHLDDQGKIDHFRVYFNPVCKFNSMNQSIPSFPYFNY